jgi:hypothetical protein
MNMQEVLETDNNAATDSGSIEYRKRDTAEE